jgi:Cu-Zn family superoxide dismutase
MRAILLFIAGAAGAVVAACDGPAEQTPAALPPLAPPGWAEKAAVLVGPDGGRIGEVLFRSAPGGVLMRTEARGLSVGWHGIHFHQTADCSDGGDGFKKSGGHVDPGAREHGLLHAAGAEEGDLPNIWAGPEAAPLEIFGRSASGSGAARAEIFRAGVSLSSLLDSDGFAVIVHADPDDHETQPIGGAGARVACAAVGA